MEFEYDPAGDADLSLGERSLSVRREAGLVGATMNLGWRCGCIAYMRAMHRLQVVGREHVPACRPLMVVANHASHLDTPALSAALPQAARSHLYPLAAADTFFESRTSRAVASSMINALPVRRGRAMRHAIADLRDRLRKPHGVYILYPEGTRSADGSIGAFKCGLGMLVAETPVAVLPACIQGAHAAWPRDRRWPRPGRITVTFGTALTFERMANQRSGWNQIAAETQAAIETLAGHSTESS